MTSTELLRTWMTTLAALELVDGRDRDATALENMEVFSIADAQDCGVPTSALVDFVHAAHRAYSLAATRVGLAGWFYAWHDAQAGQLRMSACRIASASELPFRGRISVVEDPAVIAADALSSEIAHGIPWSHLVEVPLSEVQPEPDPPPTLVFARALTALA
jgi:hypothetical protein